MSACLCPPTHPRQIPLLPDATPWLAAVDLDWEHVRAVDIFAVLRSFVPQDGSIRSVTVYPSGVRGRREGWWDAGVREGRCNG